MKSLILFTVLSFSLIAKAGDATKPLSKVLSEKVKASLVIPSSVKQGHGSQKITIYFVVDAEGKVTEVSANSTNQQLRTDIESQFMKLNLKGLTPGVYNSIDVNFVVG